MLDFDKVKPLWFQRCLCHDWRPVPGVLPRHPPSTSFCLPLAQDVCDGQRLQLITLQRPGLTPSVCLGRKAFAFWMPAFCKLIRVCSCVCVRARRRLHRFAACPHELWLTAVSMSEVRARLAMLSFTVTGTSLVCVQPAGSGFGRTCDASATLCPRSRPVPSSTFRKSKLNKWSDRCCEGNTLLFKRKAGLGRVENGFIPVEKFWVCWLFQFFWKTILGTKIYWKKVCSLWPVETLFKLGSSRKMADLLETIHPIRATTSKMCLSDRCTPLLLWALSWIKHPGFVAFHSDSQWEVQEISQPQERKLYG